MNVSKSGYVSLAWGQRRPASGGRRIPLADGDAREIAIDLPRAGVITGMVVNDRGEPVIGTGVVAARVLSLGGGRTARSIGGTATDDRGIYRFHSLQPGQYIVCAAPDNQHAMSDRGRLRLDVDLLRRARAGAAGRSEAEQRSLDARLADLEARLQHAAAEPARGLAPACVPSAGPRLGSTISIAPGEERTSVDLRLERTRLTAIEGSVNVPADVDPRQVQVMLGNTNELMPFSGRGATAVDENGSFLFADLAPGEYRLVARTRAEPLPPPGAPRTQPAEHRTPFLWAQADLLVDGTDLTGLVLELQPGFTVSGEVVFQGTSPRPPDPSRLQVAANPVHQPAMAAELAQQVSAHVDEAGRFTLANVLPGTYRIGTAAAGWHLLSVMAGEQDVLDFPLDVRTSVSGVVITLSDRMAEISGSVTDSRGAPAWDHDVLLFPVDSRYWTSPSRRTRVSRSERDGSFRMPGLPAGDYYIIASPDIPVNDLNLPDAFEEFGALATRVTLREGERRRLSLRASGG